MILIMETLIGSINKRRQINMKKILYINIVLFWSCSLTLLGYQAEDQASSSDIKEKFEQAYQAYIRPTTRPTTCTLWDNMYTLRSNIGSVEKSRHLHDIAELGVPALPYIVEKMKETNGFRLNLPFFIITKKTFEESDYPEDPKARKDARAGNKMVIQWWEEGRKETPQRFSNLYAEWKHLREAGKDKEATSKYYMIRNLGIDALPLIVQKIGQGDSELVPIVAYLDNDVSSTATVSQVVSWWAENRDKLTLPPVEEPVTPAPTP